MAYIEAVVRMAMAVDKVNERLHRAAQALNDARVPYAVIGGNAVADWVARVDASAVRNTKDVDILLPRSELENAEKALARVGFIRRNVAGFEMFLDGSTAQARDAVHVVFANEKVRDDYVVPAPDITHAVESGGMVVLGLHALITMKLTSFRMLDQVHLKDLYEVGLIDETTFQHVPTQLHARLRQVLEDDEGSIY
jgi:hypothetical protein